MFLSLLEYVLFRKNQNKQQHYFVHAKQPNEFQYQSAHQDLLYMPHPHPFL